MFLHSWHPQPLISTIGGLELHWYGLLLAIAALVGIGLVQYIGKRYGLDHNRLFDATLIILVVGFVGARLYHVLNEWTYYSAHTSEIWKVWNGGLALHGGLIAGAVTLYIIARRWKWDMWLLADITVPAFAIAQAIGRWGNYFNQELFGKPTSRPWGIPIDIANRPSEFMAHDFFHPTFLYESLGLLVISGIVYFLHERRLRKNSGAKKTHYGNIALIYIILASLLRIATETLRIDHTPIIGGIRLPILMAGIFIVASTITLFIRYRKFHVHS